MLMLYAFSELNCFSRDLWNLTEEFVPMFSYKKLKTKIFFVQPDFFLNARS